MCTCDPICMNGLTRHTIRVSGIKRYRVEAHFGRKGDPGSDAHGWQWADTVDVPVSVSIVTNDQLKNQLSPIIFLSNSPVNWDKVSIVHDIVEGTLDFTNYTYAETPGEGEFIGYIDFQYKEA